LQNNKVSALGLVACYQPSKQRADKKCGRAGQD